MFARGERSFPISFFSAACLQIANLDQLVAQPVGMNLPKNLPMQDHLLNLLQEFQDGVPTFLLPKIPAKKLSFSSMSGNTGKPFRVAWEKAIDLPSSEVLIGKNASFHVPTPLMHAASASLTSSAVFAREQ